MGEGGQEEEVGEEGAGSGGGGQLAEVLAVLPGVGGWGQPQVQKGWGHEMKDSIGTVSGVSGGIRTSLLRVWRNTGNPT